MRYVVKWNIYSREKLAIWLKTDAILGGKLATVVGDGGEGVGFRHLFGFQYLITTRNICVSNMRGNSARFVTRPAICLWPPLKSNIDREGLKMVCCTVSSETTWKNSFSMFNRNLTVVYLFSLKMNCEGFLAAGIWPPDSQGSNVLPAVTRGCCHFLESAGPYALAVPVGAWRNEQPIS